MFTKENEQTAHSLLLCSEEGNQAQGEALLRPGSNHLVSPERRENQYLLCRKEYPWGK